jgi:GTP-binding protein EngB required for normal cell division
MSVRFFIALILLLVALLALFVALIATDTALSVWQRLSQAPLWLQAGYTLLLGGFVLAILLVSWRWLRPRRKPEKKPEQAILSESELQERLLDSASAGVDVGQALDELQEQRKRKADGEIYLALFGEVSTGKSSLVTAMLPEAKAPVDARAGSTTAVRHYRWRADSRDRVVLADLPGFNLSDNPAILEEARRAHLVIFLCDEDLTASQLAQLEDLKRLNKPLVLALNKLDRYSDQERQAILQRIVQRSGLPREDVVTVQTGGREEIVRQLADGSEQQETRPRPVEVTSLVRAVQRHLDNDRELIESLRDTAVLQLASEKLHAARDQHREEQAAELVSVYSRRAIVGALAAVAPGSDLVIQGVLATRLIQELCALYDVSVKEVQIESFLKLAGGKVRKMSALTLAIAGNALKAFPGIGTLTGGMLHAVAYGMIFDSLGRAAAQTLASRGELRPYPAAAAFEELLSENLESGAERFARLALTRQKRPPTS